MKTELFHSDMRQIIIYIILLSPTIYELWTDLYRIKVKGKEDNHIPDLPVRLVLMIGVAFALHFFYDLKVLPMFLCSVSLFLALFNPVIGLFLKGNPLYVRDKGFDKWLAERMPPHGRAFWYLWWLGMFIALYYNWDLIGLTPNGIWY